MGMTTKALKKPSPARGFLTADVIKELRAANGRVMNVGQFTMFDAAEVKAGRVAPTENVIAPEGIYSLFGVRPGVKSLTDFTVTPELARKLLELNIQNRSLSDKQIQQYAREIQEGGWTSNGDTIRFSSDGVLLDGQHRLSACVLANTPFVTDIRFDLPRVSQLTIDSGRKRSVGDQLGLLGEQYGPAINAAARVLFGIAYGVTSVNLSTLEVATFLNKNPDLRDSVVRVYKQKIKGANPAQLAAIHYIATKCLNKAKQAEMFVNVFATGIAAYTGDPAQKLRERLIEYRLAKRPLNTAMQLQNLIYVWEQFRDARPVPRLTIMERDGIEVRGFDPSQIGIDVAAKRISTGRANMPARAR